MRTALVCIAFVWVIGCAGSSKIRRELEVDKYVEADPPVATFRWALEPRACGQGQLRSSIETCQSRDGMHDDHTVAVYTPTDDTESHVTVIRYDGTHIGAPLRWQKHIDLGPAPHSAVVTVVRDAVIVAAISRGSARVAAIDNIRGRMLGIATIVEAGAMSVQVEGIDDFARIHVRTTSGGAVAVMHPRNARVLAKRDISERAILEQAPPVLRFVEAEVTEGDVTVRWEDRRLVARRGNDWILYLRAEWEENRALLHRVALHRIGDRLLITIHDTKDSRIEVRAVGLEKGDELWKSTLTGGTHHAFTNLAVGGAVDDDQFLVHGVAPIETFICTIGIEDGVERGCVDRLQPDGHGTVIDFGEDQIVTP